MADDVEADLNWSRLTQHAPHSLIGGEYDGDGEGEGDVEGEDEPEGVDRLDSEVDVGSEDNADCESKDALEGEMASSSIRKRSATFAQGYWTPSKIRPAPKSTIATAATIKPEDDADSQSEDELEGELESNSISKRSAAFAWTPSDVTWISRLCTESDAVLAAPRTIQVLDGHTLYNTSVSRASPQSTNPSLSSTGDFDDSDSEDEGNSIAKCPKTSTSPNTAVPCHDPTKSAFTLTASEVVKALNGHTLYKAFRLRDSRLRRGIEPQELGNYFIDNIPYAVEHLAEEVFAAAEELAVDDARFYLRPYKRAVHYSKVFVTAAGLLGYVTSPAASLGRTYVPAAASNERKRRFSQLDPPRVKPLGLFDLPAELRNDIYELVLLEDQPIELNTTFPALVPPGVLAVNRGIRDEALSIYYSSNTFQATVREENTAFLWLWLDGISEESGSLIRHLIVHWRDSTFDRLYPRAMCTTHPIAALTKCLEARHVCCYALEHRVNDLGRIDPDTRSLQTDSHELTTARHFVQSIAGHKPYFSSSRVSDPCGICRGSSSNTGGLPAGTHTVCKYQASLFTTHILTLPKNVPFLLPKRVMRWKAEVQSMESYLGIIIRRKASYDGRVGGLFEFSSEKVAAMKWQRLSSGNFEDTATDWLDHIKPHEFQGKFNKEGAAILAEALGIYYTRRREQLKRIAGEVAAECKKL